MKPRGIAAMDEETRTRVQSAGGNKTLQKYGHEHFSKLGKKGGRAVVNKYGKEHMAEIGTIGGSRTKITTEERDENPVHFETE